ncbi:hypothetical protein C8J56DRAFT_1074908 [Mycena floridula]|nr:hypothetical protein C8J56DRAFT_1074908 [Mycena floridula]
MSTGQLEVESAVGTVSEMSVNRKNEGDPRPVQRASAHHDREPKKHRYRSVSPSSSSSEEDKHRSSSKHRRRHSRSRSPESRRSRKDRDDRKRRKERKEERRSALTGKRIKLKVKKEKGDEERDANRKDLLQFLNSTFE